ncbi:MAG TPA: hypothetical protein VHN99_03140 [Deinococcales bacterium]|nr:hypothetical protein [Deinococcales bacterium]
MTQKAPPAVTALQMTIRIVGLALIVLGVLVWPGTRDGLIPYHMILGIVLVVCLWLLAAQAARNGASSGAVWLAVIWGALTAALGMTQERIFEGGSHWVIQVLHLIVGIGAIGIAEQLGATARRAPIAARR